MNGYAFVIVNKTTLDSLAFGCGRTEEHRDEMIEDTEGLCSLVMEEELKVIKSEIPNYDGGFGVWWVD